MGGGEVKCEEALSCAQSKKEKERGRERARTRERAEEVCAFVCVGESTSANALARD